MNKTMLLLGGLFWGLLLPFHGTAQTRLIPQAGLFASVSDLGTVDTADGIRRVGEQEASLALGLTLEFCSDNVVALRIQGLYGTDSEVPVGGIGCSGSACDFKSTLLGVSAAGTLRPFPSGFLLGPYLVAGGGIKRYDFEFESGSQLKDAFGDDTRSAWILGVGFDWDLALLKGNLELVDYISDSVLPEGDRQHDFFLTVGLRLG